MRNDFGLRPKRLKKGGFIKGKTAPSDNDADDAPPKGYFKGGAIGRGWTKPGQVKKMQGGK